MNAAKKFTREQLITETWYRGNLGYLHHAGQKKIDKAYSETKNQLFVGNVSRQFGKSYWAVSEAIETAIKKPKARIKYATAFQTDLVEFILPTFDAVLLNCPKGLRPTYKVQGSKWVFPNGSEIKLLGCDKSPNSLRGNVIDLIILDEAGFIESLDYIYKSIIVPATLHRPNCKIILISTPPNTPAHAFIDFIQKAQVEGGYIELSIYENPLITQADIERMAKELGGYESTSFRRECLCELVTDDHRAIIPDWKDDYIQEIPRDENYHHYHAYVGMDLGRVDNTALCLGTYLFKRAAIYIEDEIVMEGSEWTTITLKDVLLAKEKELWGEKKPFRRVADNNNPHLINDLSSLHNVFFMQTDKDALEAMVNAVREMVARGQVIVHPRCINLIGCLRWGVWDSKRRGFDRSKKLGHFDMLAALIYLIRNIAKHTNPIPADHGFVNHKAWLGNIKDQRTYSNNARVIKNALIPKFGGNNGK